MKTRITITLLSLMIIGTCLAEGGKQPNLTEIFGKIDGNNRSIEALVVTMGKLELKKQEAGRVSDLVCKKYVPMILASLVGISASIAKIVPPLLHRYCEDNSYQEFPESETTQLKPVLFDGIVNGMFFCFYSYFATKILIGLLSGVMKVCVEKRTERKYESELRRLKETIHEEVTDISSNEKDELISRLEHVYGL